MLLSTLSRLSLTTTIRSSSVPFRELQTTAVLERARKGTRERKRKVYMANKKKKEERLRKNPPPLPLKVQLKLKSEGIWGKPKPQRDPDDRPWPVDDVYITHLHAWKRWDFEEAVQVLREAYHPTIFNRPDSMIKAKVEFYMRAVKKEKYIEGFTKMVPIANKYDRGVQEKTVMAFVPNDEEKDKALAAGAAAAGGEELITEIMKGRVEVADYDVFLCHDEMGVKMKPLMGVLREKCPKKFDGTIGPNLPRMIQVFGSGMSVQVEKVTPGPTVAEEPDYGCCEFDFGLLSMEDAPLNENLTEILKALAENKPKRDGDFITRVMLYVDGPFKKKLAIKHEIIDDKRLKEETEKQVASS